MNDELKEWLGLTPQDFLVYAALLACATMYVSRTIAVDIIAAGFGVGTSVVACMWGVRPEVRFAGFTNWVKKVSYPVCVAFVLGCIYLNFQLWNARP